MRRIPCLDSRSGLCYIFNRIERKAQGIHELIKTSRCERTIVSENPYIILRRIRELSFLGENFRSRFSGSLEGGAIFSNFEKTIELNGRLSRKVLVLNHNYEPLSICNVRKAVILLFLGKAELIAACDGKSLHSVSTTMPYPSIVRLCIYVRIPYKKIVLSRKNILRRDGHRCQYCGKTDISLTVDHIIPKAHGGIESWENLVAACVQCNNKKGDRSPGEAQMTLLRKPIRPNHVMFIQAFCRYCGRSLETISFYELIFSGSFPFSSNGELFWGVMVEDEAEMTIGSHLYPCLYRCRLGQSQEQSETNILNAAKDLVIAFFEALDTRK